MIHYSCDCCKRPIDPQADLRYVVKVEVYASLDPHGEELDDDRDHLQEIQDILENLSEEEDQQVADDVFHQARFDLCSACRKLYVQNPLGRGTRHELGFSKN
jgi:hypothetical protein